MNAPDQNDLPEVLTFTEFRQALKCSKSTGYRLIWNGTVKSCKVRGRLLIHRASVVKLLRPKEEGPCRR